MQRLATTTRRRRRGLCAAAFLVLALIVPVSSPGSLVEKIVVVVNDVPHNGGRWGLRRLPVVIPCQEVSGSGYRALTCS